ncbi:MAG TPA: GerMN domain-containing protein [Longimicrobiales bacterium]|nr:GerMN domain-containing protein [Longimicrobiales bacterium]
MVPLPRTVSADRDPAAASIAAVVAGVSEAEADRGCSSFFSSRTANSLRDVRRSSNGDTVIVDFRNFTDALPEAPGVKSFLPPGVMAELTWTLFHQFPDIAAARFLFDGDEQAFWTWLGGPGTAAHAFTRAMWEQI